MPINPTYEYGLAVKKYDKAKTSVERLAALQEMLATAPKHKGAESLLMNLKKKIADLRKDLEKERIQAKKSAGAPEFSVKKEGDAQIVFVGYPNIGKSTLLSKITNATPKIANYEFTTLIPEVGMMDCKGARVQVVDLPGLILGAATGKGGASALLSIVRNADLVVFMASLERAPPDEQVLQMVEELEKARIYLNRQRPDVEVKPNSSGGVVIEGARLIQGNVEAAKAIARSMGYSNALILVREKVSLENFARALDEGSSFKNACVACTKKDAARHPFEGLHLKLPGFSKGQVFFISQKENLEYLKEELFALLERVRIYTKKPDEAPDREPLVLKKGSTVIQACEAIHKDLAKKFKFARLWGKSARFAGQRVSPNHVLLEGDVLEVHA